MVQDGPEFNDLPLRYLGGQDRLRSVKRFAPLVEFDPHASLPSAAARTTTASSRFGSSSAVVM
jgi:hypothetical protein